jgi:predicted MFS family arabinose efflux permease
MIFADPCLRLFVPCALILNLLGSGPLTLMLPFCLEKGLTVDMYGYGISVYTAASVLCVLALGVVKLRPKGRFWIMAIGFSSSVLFSVAMYLSTGFVPLCVFAFLFAFANCAGNSIFNASLMLALPEANRGAILGLISSASVGGSALSAVIYGVLGDVFPLYLTFTIGSLISLVPMLYLCFHPRTKAFVLEH